MLDHIIPKPPTIKPYQAHQMVQGLADGNPVLFADKGDRLLVRTSQKLTKDAQQVRQCLAGDVVGFELRACVSKKRKGKHLYPDASDWRVRHQWLDRQAEKHGFEVLTVNCHAERLVIDDQRTRKFAVDQTDFVGVLKVVDEEKFKAALEKGIGSTARTFGFGMLEI